MEPQTVGRSGRRRPGLLLRWFFRAPVVLYRVGLGWLMFGQMMLTTVGRKSGRPQETVVDVLGHDAATDTYYALSAYGGHSDWYRNIQTNPAMRIRVRRREFPASATTLPEKEGEQVVLDFWRRHRFYTRTMLRLIGLKAATEEDVRKAVAEMKIVAFQPVADDR